MRCPAVVARSSGVIASGKRNSRCRPSVVVLRTRPFPGVERPVGAQTLVFGGLQCALRPSSAVPGRAQQSHLGVAASVPAGGPRTGHGPQAKPQTLGGGGPEGGGGAALRGFRLGTLSAGDGATLSAGGGAERVRMGVSGQQWMGQGLSRSPTVLGFLTTETQVWASLGGEPPGIHSGMPDFFGGVGSCTGCIRYDPSEPPLKLKSCPIIWGLSKNPPR